MFWKLATISLLSKDGNIFTYNKEDDKERSFRARTLYDYGIADAEFTDEKIKEDISIKEQMEKEIKKLIYSQRKSAAMFYSEEPDYSEFSRRYLD